MMKTRHCNIGTAILFIVSFLFLTTSCKEKLSLSPTNVTFDFPAAEKEIQVTANVPWQVESTADWCTIQDGKGEKDGLFKIQASLNESVEERSALVILTGGENLRDSLLVTQSAVRISEENFNLDQNSYTFNASGETVTIELTCLGEWALDTGSKPNWIKVHPTSGKGDASIELVADKNMLLLPRKAALLFVNKLTNNSISFKTHQVATTMNGLTDYRYLGLGYNAAGQYAHSSETRAAILDWNKLADKGYISPSLTDSELKERYIYGSTSEIYQSEMGVAAGISANYKGFSMSVNTTFNKEQLTSKENEFATYYKHTPQAFIKLHDHVTAENLQDCLTNEAMEEINGSMNAANVIEKYGTHVLAGFVLGGTMTYSLSADMSFSSSAARWEMAVKAGYKSIGGGGEVSGSESEYEKVISKGVNVKENTDARGGDAQLASIKNGNHSKWLDSLSDPDKWVMIDFTGNGLLDISKLAKAPKRQAELQKAVQNKLMGNLPNATSTHKRFKIKFTSANFTGNAAWDKCDLFPEFNNGTIMVNGEIDRAFISHLRLQLPDKTDSKNPKGYRFPSRKSHNSGNAYGTGNGESSAVELSILKDNKVEVKFDVKINGESFRQSFIIKYDKNLKAWKKDGDKTLYSSGDAITHTMIVPKKLVRESGNLNMKFTISWE